MKKLVLAILILALLAGCFFVVTARTRDNLPEPEEETEPVPTPEPTAVPTPAAAPSTPVPDPITSTGVQITEVVPSNKAIIRDEDGEYSDYLELTNLGGKEEDLSGWWLSDGKDPQKWRIGDLTLAPGEKRVIFCSGKDRGQGELHTGFSLSSKGETITLATPEGIVLRSVAYDEAESNKALYFLDGELVSSSYLATPGYEDSEEGYEQFIAAHDSPGPLVVNEAVLYNLSYAKHNNDYYDWIELKNISEEPIVLSDYCLSDDPDRLDLFRLPEKTLKSGEVFVVFCSGNEALGGKIYCHAPFALSSKGEGVYITDKDGALSDAAYIHPYPANGSLGRVKDGHGLFYFAAPTPGKENGTGFRTLAAAPVSSVAQGVYNGVESLVVELSGEGSIYYTTSGAAPTTKSKLYTEPIVLTQTTVIRAISVVEGKLSDDSSRMSFIINENDALPVTSVICEPTAFNTMYNNGYVELTAEDATVSFFDGEEGFTAGCSIKLHGASSRFQQIKKSMKLTFRTRYGGDVNYDLFGDGQYTEFHSLLLRAGTANSLEIFKDNFATEVARTVCPIDPLALDYRYCALYVNGEFRGVYSWREAYSDEYYAYHTGSDPDSVEVGRAPVESGELARTINFITSADMSVSENYAKACDLMDMDSLACWTALEAYFNNDDIEGNVRYFRGSQPDGKWRMAFFDLDYTINYGAPGWDKVLSPGHQTGRMLLSLIKSPEFCRLLLERTAEMVRNGLNEEGIREIYDRVLADLDDDSMQRECTRWKGGFGMWKSYTQTVLPSYLSHTRTELFISALAEYTKADEATIQELFGDYL